MTNNWTQVSTNEELTAALTDGVLQILVDGEIHGMPMITLSPGTSLRGGKLVFGGKGVRITTDNSLLDICIETNATELAILADTTVASLGTLTLDGVTTRGQIGIIAEDALLSGHIIANNVFVQSADVRGRTHRPHAYGVDALQGGFTIWNRQSAPESILTAELRNIAAGTSETPIRGSGVFVGGAANDGGSGTVEASIISTGIIETDGGIAPGTPDVISGGVFVIGGARVELVENIDTVTTHGQNDMVLDNWGEVQTWTASKRIASYGSSGIGFVNFGTLGTLTVSAPLETFGDGSRGFNLYDGSIQDARFQSISTSGDGAIGIQISKPMPKLTVSGDITTSGSIGTSLVKGQQMVLQAMALSIKPGGSIDTLDVAGEISTSGDNIVTSEFYGPIGSATILKGIHAMGVHSAAVRAAKPIAALAATEVSALSGQVFVQA